jgi:tetratricopeptide (TPR) repeat protein
MSSKHPRAALNVVVLALLCGAVWATFGRAIHAPFLYDDRPSFLENDTIRQLWPLSVPLQPPREHPFSARPLVNLSAAVNYHFGGLDPAGYRLVNMALHALSAMLLFGIVGRTLMLSSSPLSRGARTQTVANVLAFVVALLWAIHPLQTETVCYVTQRTELMVGLFYLATVYCSLRYWLADTGPGRITWLVLAVIACAAGMTSKEVMVSAPLIVLLFERTFLTHDLRKLLRRSWLLYVGLCLTWLLLVYVIADAPRSKSAGFGLGLPMTTWWLTQVKVVVLYLKLACWPWPLSIHYHMPYVQGVGEVFPWLLVVGVLGVGTLAALWRGWAVGFLGAWFFIILSPTSLVPIISEVAAERRMYLPLAAIVVLVVVGGYWLVLRISQRAKTDQQTVPKSWAAGMIVVAAILSVTLWSISYHRLAAYESEVSIWQDTLAQYPESEVVHLSLAMALSRADRIDESADHFNTAIRLEPLNLYHRIRFAEALKKAGRHAEAIVQLREVVLRRPDLVDAHYELALLLRETDRNQEAAEHFRAVVNLRPNYPSFRVQYAETLRTLGKRQEAIDEFEQAVRLQPENAQTRDALGLALMEAGQTQRAAEQWSEAVRLEPEDADLRNHYGEALRQSGIHLEAIRQFRQALELEPHAREPHVGLAMSFAALGRQVEAIDQYEALLKLYPNDGPVHAALGKLLMETGKYEPAIEHFQRAVEFGPRLAEDRHDLGAALLEVGRADEAIAELEECVRQAPDSPATQFTLADAYAVAGRHEEAVSRARQALSLARDQQDWALVEQIDAWLSAQQHDE